MLLSGFVYPAGYVRAVPARDEAWSNQPRHVYDPRTPQGDGDCWCCVGCWTYGRMK